MIDYSYFAGVFDIKGVFYVQNIAPRICVFSNNYKMLEAYRDITGIGRVQKDTNRNWNLRKPEIIDFLPKILPFMVIQNQRANLFLQYFMATRDKQILILSDIKNDQTSTSPRNRKSRYHCD